MAADSVIAFLLQPSRGHVGYPEGLRVNKSKMIRVSAEALELTHMPRLSLSGLSCLSVF